MAERFDQLTPPASEQHAALLQEIVTLERVIQQEGAALQARIRRRTMERESKSDLASVRSLRQAWRDPPCLFRAVDDDTYVRQPQTRCHAIKASPVVSACNTN